MKTDRKTAPKRSPTLSKAIKKPRRVVPNVVKVGTGEERFRNIFDTVPVSIWVEDFSEVKKLYSIENQLVALRIPHYLTARRTAPKVAVVGHGAVNEQVNTEGSAEGRFVGRVFENGILWRVNNRNPPLPIVVSRQNIVESEPISLN